MDIKVCAIHLFDGPGPVKAWIDIRIDKSITVRDFKVLDRGKGLIVDAPERIWKINGQARTKHIVSLQGDLKANVEATILQAYHAAREERINGRLDKVIK